MDANDQFCPNCGEGLDDGAARELPPTQATTETPVGDDLDVDVVGRRVGAVLVDSVVVSLVVFLLAGLIRVGGLEGLVLFLLPVSFLYFWLLEARWNGQTVGKRALGIAVVKENGGPISLTDSFVRNLLRVIDGLFYYLVGLILIVVSERNQRLGDMAADTLVERVE